MLGLPDPSSQFIVCKLLNGYNRQRPGKDTRLPITPSILKSALANLPTVCTNKYESGLFASAYTIAFFGFFRVGELTVTKGNSIDNIISINDIAIEKESLIITLRYSKTNQLGDHERIGIKRSQDQICPIRFLIRYLRMRPKFGGPLFCHFDGSPVTRYQFTSVLKKALSNAGFNYTRFSSHSFRIGAATTAALNGIPADQIQKAGRWRSQAVRSYIRPSLVSVPDLI